MGTPWTEEELKQLKGLLDEGKTYTEIMKVIKRSKDSLKHAITAYGLRTKPISKKAVKKALSLNRFSKPLDNDKAKEYETILSFGDMQIPFHHPDSIKFLKAVKAKYKPDLVVCVGDLVDQYAFSEYDHDPSVDNATRELQTSKEYLAELKDIFKEMYICKGNHDDRLMRKAVKAGLPAEVFKPLNVIYDLPDTWYWNFSWTFNTELIPLHFVHTYSGGINGVKGMGMSVIQGHLHAEFKVIWGANPVLLFWDAWLGCLFDKDSHAAAYGKTQSKKCILGCCIIHKGIPHLIPMVLKRGGSWIGTL